MPQDDDKPILDFFQRQKVDDPRQRATRCRLPLEFRVLCQSNRTQPIAQRGRLVLDVLRCHDGDKCQIESWLHLVTFSDSDRTSPRHRFSPLKTQASPRA